MLCFVDATWELFASPLRFDDARVMWPKELYKFVRTDGGLTTDDIRRIERKRAAKLPSAS